MSLFPKPKVVQWLAADQLRNKLGFLAPYVAIMAYAISRVCGQELRSLRYLMFASRASNGRLFTGVVRSRLDSIRAMLPQLLDGQTEDDQTLKRCIVLRAPDPSAQPRWKGILLISFTGTSGALARDYDLQRLAKDFHIILEPSWAGYCDPHILLWTTVSEQVLVQSSEAGDRRFLRDLNTNLVPVDFGASDWVNPSIFHPDEKQQKIYDTVYVANRRPYKRVHTFLKAVRKICRTHPGFKAALVCHHWGAERDIVDDLINHYGVAQYVEFLDSVPYDKIKSIYSASKSCVLMSLKEGSNRSLFEAMFCGTSVVLLAENVGVNKDYINDETGLLVRERDLAEALLRLSREWDQFTPRQWAMKNIAPDVTTAKLAGVLKSLNPNEHVSNEAIWVKTNSPEVEYLYAGEGIPRQSEALVAKMLAPYRRGNPLTTPKAS